MIKHNAVADGKFSRSRKLKTMIDAGEMLMAGNLKLKIYGHLNCSSGKRMKAENRVFFKSVSEAEEAGYRPCGRCMREQYKLWKSGSVKYYS